MEWIFGDYRLNADRAELSGPDGVVHIERQPLDLLMLLVRHADRVVSKDEIIEAVWQGRIVSDSAVSTAIKQVRRAIGDTGEAQEMIRTVYGRGFRFAAAVTVADAPPAAASAPSAEAPQGAGHGKPSLAVLRFLPLSSAPAHLPLADAVPAELISSLSRLGWLHLIARGSSFQFDPAAPDMARIRETLGVRYLLGGQIEIVGEIMTITAELYTPENGALVWSERYAAPLIELHEARARIVASVISALEFHLPRHEAQAARHLSPDQLDAWGHFHLGLRHMYRFRPDDNRIAAEHFRTAMGIDPEFGRAHAGLSFTHWQNAFMQFGSGRDDWLREAEAAAARALEIDELDPFASYNMGRAKWLTGAVDEGLHWYDRALQVNPNYAQCHYAKGLGHAMMGEAGTARTAARQALSLSPLDPLAYAMHSAEALSLIGEDRFDEAARKMQDAVRSVDAHFYIYLFAAAANELSGDRAMAQQHLRTALGQNPDATVAQVFQAFPFTSDDLRRKFALSLGRLGLKDA